MIVFGVPVPFNLCLFADCQIEPCDDTDRSSVALFQGIVGNLASGKSALVHRYLTGTYVQEESPEGMLLGRQSQASESLVFKIFL